MVHGDVRSAADAARVFNLISTEAGKLDVLVNNVGDNLRLRGAFESLSEESWDALYDINLRHIFRVTKLALPLIRQTGCGGSIINISHH